MSLGAVYCAFNACSFLQESVERVYPVVEKVVFLVNHRPWGLTMSPLKSETLVKKTLSMILGIPDPDEKFEIVIGYWPSEEQQRNFGLKVLSDKDVEWCLIVDDDEFFNTKELARINVMLKDAQHAAYLIYHQMYWKDRKTIVKGVFGSFPTFARTNGLVHFNRNRMILVNKGHTWFSISAEDIVCHHLSYVRSDEEMRLKIENFSHADEIIPDWYERVWLGNATTNLHPTYETEFPSLMSASESKYKLI